VRRKFESVSARLQEYTELKRNFKKFSAQEQNKAPKFKILSKTKSPSAFIGIDFNF
jgi:hypothetical protein